MSLRSKIQSLINASNETTGESSTDLTSAVQNLIDGYGSGVTKYSISYTLGTNVVSSNTAKKIAENESYTTTISTSDPDYTVDVITVTMGGVDITSAAVTGNVISIATVTGNVLITVTVIEPVVVTSISATYTQTGTIYDVDSLDALRSDLVVVANYSDSSTVAVNDYTLSGTLTEGTSIITVAYGGKTTTFNVTVTELELYTVQSSDVGGWGYTNYDGTQYATNNTLSNMSADITAIAFADTVVSNRHVLWRNIRYDTEYVRYNDGAVTDQFNNNGASDNNSALKNVVFSDTALAMLRTINIKYAPNLVALKSLDLSKASNLTSLKIEYCSGLTSLPVVPDTVTSFSCAYNTALVDLSDWETPSGVTTLYAALTGCTALVKGPIINSPNCTNFNLMIRGGNNVLEEITIKSVDTNQLFGSGKLINENSIGAYRMIKCAPNNNAFPVIRATFASSNNSDKFGLTGIEDGTVNRICMYGDSLTKYKDDTGTYGTMPSQLLNMMADNVVVQNYGVPGAGAPGYKSYFDSLAKLQAPVSVVWLGTNHTGETGEAMANSIKTNIVDGLNSDNYVVIGLLQKNYTSERNIAMSSVFGVHYLDIHAYTLANWETITGLTPTEDDETAVANGNIPPSLLQSDNTHLNPYSGLIVATAIKEKLLSLGYIDSTWLASN